MMVVSVSTTCGCQWNNQNGTSSSSLVQRGNRFGGGINITSTQEEQEETHESKVVLISVKKTNCEGLVVPL